MFCWSQTIGNDGVQRLHIRSSTCLSILLPWVSFGFNVDWPRIKRASKRERERERERPADPANRKFNHIVMDFNSRVSLSTFFYGLWHAKLIQARALRAPARRKSRIIYKIAVHINLVRRSHTPDVWMHIISSPLFRQFLDSVGQCRMIERSWPLFCIELLQWFFFVVDLTRYFCLSSVVSLRLWIAYAQTLPKIRRAPHMHMWCS